MFALLMKMKWSTYGWVLSGSGHSKVTVLEAGFGLTGLLSRTRNGVAQWQHSKLVLVEALALTIQLTREQIRLHVTASSVTIKYYSTPSLSRMLIEDDSTQNHCHANIEKISYWVLEGRLALVQCSLCHTM